jgi:hypothetical protein
MRHIPRTTFTVLVAMLAMSALTAAPALASGKPFVETKPASKVGETVATFNGVVNPNGAATKYHFQYGATIAYGKTTTEVSVGEGIANLEESQAIGELAPETTYHFRIVATNSNGTSDGEDATFTTGAKGSSNFPRFFPAEGVKFPIALESKSTGEWEMNSEGTRVDCKGSKLKGEITGPKALSVTTELEGCVDSQNGKECHSKGLAEGHLVINGDGQLVYLSKAKKEVATILTLPAKFECGTATGVTEGGALIPLKPVNKKSSDLTFKAEARGAALNEQVPAEYENEKGKTMSEHIEWDLGGAERDVGITTPEEELTATSQFTLEA